MQSGEGFWKELGAVFDWDGVVIDSHDQHQKSWFVLAEEIGRSLTHEQFKESFGMRNEHIIPHLFKWADPEDPEAVKALGNRKEELYRELLKADGLDPLPGVKQLLRGLQEAGVPCSIGSSTPTKNIETGLEITGLAEYFAAITAAEDVSRGKPDPEVFQIAARKVSREPANCVVFEDAHVGIEAGLAAGMRTIAVATTHPIETFSKAHRAVASLGEVSLESLPSLFAGD